jgi:hypothetical protein
VNVHVKRRFYEGDVHVNTSRRGIFPREHSRGLHASADLHGGLTEKFLRDLRGRRRHTSLEKKAGIKIVTSGRLLSYTSSIRCKVNKGVQPYYSYVSSRRAHCAR